MLWLIHLLGHDLGITSNASYWYNFWSGFGSGPVGWLFLPVVYYSHHICHENKCFRMGHPDSNGRVNCKKHGLGRTLNG